jgi:PAS domain S-box-containing protein
VSEKVKILYIDSNDTYNQNLLIYLINNNYSVKLVKNIKEALIEYSYKTPDIIICDIHLDDGNGLNYISKIKETNKYIKILILTEKANNEDLIKAISIKIDKIVFKNLSFEEIYAELKELKEPIKENIILDSSLFDLGENYYYDISKLKLMKEDEIIRLTKQESELLNELIKSKGNIVSFSVIQNKIAKDGETTLDTIRTVVRKIRKKTYSNLIINYSGIGYSINITNKSLIQDRYKININNNTNAKILLVKGDKKTNELITLKLQKFGFECDNVYTLYEAKELLNEKKYDFIIIELNLPDGDAINYIRNHEDTVETKVIVLSSELDIYYKDYLYFKGIVDYIVEGKDINYLVYNIQKTISKITSNNKDSNNILVIEQSKRICEQIKDLLQPRNYNVSIMHDITQAYEIIQTKLFSLIILDINYQNCFDFMLKIKSTLDKNIPFIILTNSHRTQNEIREAYINGARDCLKKPLFAEEFILKIDQIIEHENLLTTMSKQKELMSSYQKIVDKTTIISKTNTSGIITYANKKFCEISGYKEEELLGQSHNIIKYPKNPESLFRSIWETIKIDKRIWTGIIKNQKKDGTQYIVQTYIMPIIGNNGEIIEYIALRNDITDIFKNEEERVIS